MQVTTCPADGSLSSAVDCGFDAATATQCLGYSAACPAGARSSSFTDDMIVQTGCYCNVPACAAGTFNCVACSAGTFSEGVGASVCTNCSAGGFCPDAGAATRLVFQPCPQGRFGAQLGATSNASCTACPPGTENPLKEGTSADACLPCSVNEYEDVGGAAACTACPNEVIEGSGSRARVTLGQGAANVSACVCQGGFYLQGCTSASSECPLGTKCVACGDGTTCKEKGVTLERLPLEKG